MLTAYEESLKDLWNLNNCLETARRRGWEKGFAIGLAEGFAEVFAEGFAKGFAEGFVEGLAEGEAIGAKRNSIENARKMKSKGISVDDIAEITGLSAEEIANL